MAAIYVEEEGRKQQAEQKHVDPPEFLKYVPEDLYPNILMCAGVKDLARWECVSKEWRKLISSSEFLLKHVDKASVSRILVLRPYLQRPHLILDFANAENIVSYTLPNPHGIQGSNVRIVGSCDGLVCLIERDTGHTSFFNPATGKPAPRYVSLDHRNKIRFFWFGRHPSTGEYMLVIGGISTSYEYDGPRWISHQRTIVNRTIIKAIKLSGSGNSSQDQLEIRGHWYEPFEEIGIFLHEYIHWSCKGSILRYNLEKNEMAPWIPLPDRAPEVCYRQERKMYSTVGVLHGSLIALFKSRSGHDFQLWIMKEYEIKNSWTKHRVIRGFGSHHILSPLGSSRDGCLFVDADNKMIAKYDFIKQKVTVIKDRTCERSKAIMYAETFMAPDMKCVGK